MNQMLSMDLLSAATTTTLFSVSKSVTIVDSSLSGSTGSSLEDLQDTLLSCCMTGV